MTRITSTDRVARMLAIVPWVASQPDGVAIDEVCRRFEIGRDILIADLTTLAFVGVAPYTPDVQVDAVVEDGKVFIHLPQFFDRPLRLTPEQGLALVASGKSLLSIQGADDDGPLARGIRKVAETLGVDPDATLDVHMGDVEADTLSELQRAIQTRHTVEIDYYAFGRDERSVRRVDPHRLYADQGHWYLAAFCHEAGGDRIFRADRIRQITTLADTFAPPADEPNLAVFRPAPDDLRVTLDLAPSARWVVEQYPTEAQQELDGGAVRVTLAITARPWLERLLVRLGPEADVVTADPSLEGCTADAAARILARYER